MPYYEYECTKCGHHTEILQRISDSPITKCEHCKGRMKKIISQSTFHLKGSGWYVTDYASRNNGKDVKPGGTQAESSPAKEAKTPDNKPKKEASSESRKDTKAKDK